MENEISKLTNAEIKTTHRRLLELTGLLENGARIGANTPKIKALAEHVTKFRQEIEAEYFRRNPEEPVRWKRNFLTSCDNVISKRDEESEEHAKITELFAELESALDEFAETIPNENNK